VERTLQSLSKAVDPQEDLQVLEDLTKELVQTRDQLVALYQVSQASRGCWQVEQVLERTVETIERLVSARAVLLSIQPEDQDSLTFQTPQNFLDQEIFGQVLFCPQGKDLLAAGHFGAVRSVASLRVLVLPLDIRGATEATLGLVFEKEQQLKSPEIKQARAIADYAGAQIENVLLFQASLELTRLETEMDLAHQVQRRLLPQQVPLTPGLQIWGASQPAHRVGGDFFDFVPNAEDHVLNFLVGDVSGKGLSAALVMAMTRTILRSEIQDAQGENPQVVLQRANSALYEDFLEQNMFATVFVGSYHPQSRLLAFANAGHSPVIYLPVDGAARLLEPDGTPLGILRQTLSVKQYLPLQTGDIFMVGTDGITEAENENGERYGIDRMLDTVHQMKHLTAQGLGPRLVDDVKLFRGHRAAADDLTLLVLKAVSA
jgi:sigma-B regulation protein RsbU (phosphoserine phosphatase)